MPRIRKLLGALGDGLRVIAILPVVEFGRRMVGPSLLLRRFRARGARRRFRSPDQRLSLRRIIGAFDARLPGGGDCYRRVLLEILLDPVSASEPVHFGFRQHGGPKSGHAWLGEAERLPAVYDAEFSV
jgi:hypothetical protein